MAEQKSEHEKKNEEEKIQLYLREQEMNVYRALLETRKPKSDSASCTTHIPA